MAKDIAKFFNLPESKVRGPMGGGRAQGAAFHEGPAEGGDGRRGCLNVIHERVQTASGADRGIARPGCQP